ncbi:MAG: tetratricopeptide repeat protein [Candidatus Methylomirabilota bacterium]
MFWSTPTARRVVTDGQQGNSTSGSLGFVHLAEAYRLEGLLDDAARILQDGLTVNPESLPGRLALARIYLLRGKLDEAFAETDRIEAFSPGALETLELRAEILLRRRGGKLSDDTPGAQDTPAVMPAPGMASPTLLALYAAQGYAGQPVTEDDLRRTEADGRGSARLLIDPDLLRRLSAFREAARRRREGTRQ